MLDYEQVEKEGYLLFKKNFDKNVELLGGHNCNTLDLYSPIYGNIEIKKITKNTSARCGQFTEKTLKNSPLGNKILEENNEENVKIFVKNWYSSKKCNGFLVYNGESFNYYTFEDFFSVFHFRLQKPYCKRSGTRRVPKKDRELILNFSKDFSLEEEDIITKNANLFCTYFDIENNQYYVNKEGIVRKRSNTSNLTYHMEVFM